MLFTILYRLRGIERKVILNVHKQMDGLETAIATLSLLLAAIDKQLTDYLDGKGN